MSQPPGYPGSPADPWGSNQGPGGYPPPPGYGPPPGGYGPPPGDYGPPPGGYRPPPGDYGPPPGDYRPPPGGYGGPPAGYPAPGYGGQPPQQFSVGDAFSWAWNKLRKNAVPLLVSYLIWRAILGASNFVFQLITGLFDAASTTTNAAGQTTTTSPGLAIAGAVIGLILYAVSLVVEVYSWTALITGCLDIADGQPVTVGSFFKPRNFGPAILAALLVGLFTTLGLFLLIIPGLIFAFFASLTLYFVVDRSMGPMDALKASIALVRSNIGAVLMALLVTIAATIVGFLACCVGLVVAVPLSTLIWTYTYRKLSGGQIAAIDQPMYYPPGPSPGYPPGPPPGVPPGPQYYQGG
jgi:uncharacterized membrane protein